LQSWTTYNENNTPKNGISMTEVKNILNNYTPSFYHFGSTLDLQRMNKLNSTDSGEPLENEALQNRINKWICHWLDYKVSTPSNYPQNVPVAVATSSNPANENEKSDYNHWMLVTGVHTDYDPFESPWNLPGHVNLYGFYLMSPFESTFTKERYLPVHEGYEADFDYGYIPKSSNGINSVYYIPATIWNNNYFKPLGDSIVYNINEAEQGLYAAVMEPPTEKIEKHIIPQKPLKDNKCEGILNKRIKSYSYTNLWDSNESNDIYFSNILENIHNNKDFKRALSTNSFYNAASNIKIKRIFKVERKKYGYTLIPFDKEFNDKIVSSLILSISLKGEIECIRANDKSNERYSVRSRFDAYFSMLQKTNRRILNNWLSFNEDHSLNPGYKSVSFGRTTSDYYNTIVHYLSSSNEVTTINNSPVIEYLTKISKGSHIFYTFKISDTDGSIKSIAVTPVDKNKFDHSFKVKALPNDIYEISFSQHEDIDIIKIVATDNECISNNINSGGLSIFFLRFESHNNSI